AGRRFLPEARAALAAAQRAVAAVRAEGETLRIGFMTAALATRTRPLLDLVRRESGVATIELVELGWAEQASAVRDGKVDASLMRPPVADAGG
ncbi:LysR family transcriptional regulator, partial [Nocardia abscessus]|nr:LysR family transcriptional regulator [Nocardia abscessus]